MEIIADLHIHSRHSRATSKSLDLVNLEKWAKIKGVDVLGTGDFTHPEWIKELRSNLTEENGIVKTKSGFPFVWQTEISLIYTQGGKGRKVHNVVFAPNYEVVSQITDFLKSRGRVDYDGRPIFGMSCVEFTENLMKISDKIEIIPAHCLLPDSYIHTQKSLSKIKDIKKKDYVLTHKGRFKKVKKIYQREFSGEVIQIVPHCLKNGSYYTPEHPIYSIKSFKSCKNVPHTVCKPSCAYLKRGCKIKAFQNYKAKWSQLKDLEKGDIILYPRYNKIKDRQVLYLNQLIPDFFKEGGYIKPRNTKTFIKNALVKNQIKISKDFCRLVGYYLAEGYCTRDYVAFTFSNKERRYIDDVKELIIKSFGENIKINSIKETSEATTITIHSKILKAFFTQFYTKPPYRSFNKILPDWFIDLPHAKLKELVIGWWRGDSGYTASIDLCNQFKMIFIKLGIIPNIDVISAASVNYRRKTKPSIIEKRIITAKKDIFHFRHLSFFDDVLSGLPEFKKFSSKLERRKGWIDGDYIYLPVFKINKKNYNGLVYNLEVEDDNSYLTENLAVHNCWTPWFGVLGSKGGFDTIEEAFGDQAKHIHAIETGLSSDPEMNWRYSKMDKFALLSFSDLHSFWPWRLGREATVFELKELSYDNLIKSIRQKSFKETIEVDPNYGKYHLDGHRACGVCLEPSESNRLGKECPKCGRELTIGVLNRVEELADRKEGEKPKSWIPFRRIIPLSELISGIFGIGLNTKGAWAEYWKLVRHFGTENKVLLQAGFDELKKLTHEKMAQAIIDNREGRIKIKPGYDGEYGEPVLEKVAVIKKQKSLGDF